MSADTNAIEDCMNTISSFGMYAVFVVATDKHVHFEMNIEPAAALKLLRLATLQMEEKVRNGIDKEKFRLHYGEKQ